MNPHESKMKNISNVGVSNMRHSNGQQIALDRMEKSDINVTLHDDEEVTLEQASRDIAL